MTDARAPVLELFADLERGDIKVALSRFRPDAYVHEMMLAPGSAESTLRRRPPGACVFEVLSSAACGDDFFVEFVERVHGRNEANAPLLRAALAGRVHDGAIQALRYYYDQADHAQLRDQGRVPMGSAGDAAALSPIRSAGVVASLADGDEPEQYVRAFFAAWRHLDPDALAAWWATEGVYDNVPILSGPPRKGHLEIRELWRGWAAFMAGVDIEMVGICSHGNLVFAERLDHVRILDGSIRTLPCLAVVELQDGRIRRFTDYFDYGSFLNQPPWSSTGLPRDTDDEQRA